MPHLELYSSIMAKVSVINVDVLFIAPLGCTFRMDFHVKLIMRTAAPIVLCSLVGLTHACNSMRLRWLRARDKASADRAKVGLVSRAVDHAVSGAFLLLTTYLLLATCYLLLATYYLLLTTCDLLLTTHYPLPTTYYPLVAT